MPQIELIGLTKKYKDVTAVDNITLSIEKGELFGLLGVNGAGKTTTIKMLSILTPPTAGDATLDGRSIKTEKQYIKSKIAISPQETAVAENLTAAENLMMMAGVFSMKKEDAEKRVEALCRDLGLDAVKNKRAKKLSGGYKRRLSIAMALISNPEVLFLDEPTLGLDVLARAELWDVIKKMKGDITIILTTHYLEEAENMCDRIAVMKAGKLAALGTVSQIKAQAGEEDFEKAFISLVKEGQR